MSDNLKELDQAYEEEALEYLWSNYPTLAAAVEKAVQRGESPETIKRRAIQNGGIHREALATRCELAARHLHSVQAR